MYSAKRQSADRRAERGVSIIEATAAAAVVGIALMGFSGNTIAMTRAQGTSARRLAATELAQTQLELLRSMPLGASQLTTGNYADGVSLAANGTTGGPFTRSWTISSKDSPSYGLKTVTVTVAWNDPVARSTKVAAYVRCSTVPCP